MHQEDQPIKGVKPTQRSETRRKKFALALALVATFAALQLSRVSAQELPCPDCRARTRFKTCDRPLDGKKSIPMRVAAVSQGRCSQTIKLAAENAAANNLPDEIEIDLGPCITFAGTVGDAIQVALRESHSLSTRQYHLSCNLWGFKP